ncbi:hypothetical protein [Streptomyces aurantiogriseus]|uniref:Uncharacterized protein n=1 Tax=Streptomyces aurantiogriseus TaxID=66870 RepID=A0A918KVU3_9ACTN|nr:hypothetical protein [Streptomyces aurantiogriseus]GGR35783.1 hypothetical protein GCM10010251_60270 [Streptomyces aurantiogriseus]
MTEPSRPPTTPTVVAPTPDPLTPERDITHRHFRPGEQVVVLKGVVGGDLWGDSMRVVTPSWHTPTDEDGWRLRDPDGGRQTYITAHPRYLAHLSRPCPDCMIYVRAMGDYLLPKYPASDHVVDCGWYTTTALGQLVHVNDARGGR